MAELNDIELIDAIATQIEAAMAMKFGYVVMQKNNLTQEGVPSAPTVFFEKLFDYAYGWPGTTRKAVMNKKEFLDKTTQQWEATFQISAMVRQIETDATLPTASDVVQYVKIFLQTPTVMRRLRALGLGLLRITNVRNPYFQDDHNQIEANPNFDMVVTYQRSILMITPGTDKVVEQLVKAVA